MDPEIRAAIADLITEGVQSPAAIHRRLLREFEAGPSAKSGTPPIHVPTERTVARLVRELLPPDSSGSWSLAEATPEEAKRVLPVAAWVATTTAGRVWLTRDLAAWVDRIIAVAPDIPPRECWRMALGFRAAEGAGDERAMQAMTLRLACRTWTDEGLARWQRFAQRRVVNLLDIAFGRQTSRSVAPKIDDEDEDQEEVRGNDNPTREG